MRFAALAGLGLLLLLAAGAAISGQTPRSGAASWRGEAQQPTSTPTAGPISPPVTGPITSAGDPSDPVPFRWTVVRGTAGEGGRLVLQGGTIHAIADLARLVDAAGEALTTAPATPVTPGADPCFGRVGIVRAELPVAEETLAVLAAEWPEEYRAEVRVGGIWRPTALTYTECPSED